MAATRKYKGGVTVRRRRRHVGPSRRRPSPSRRRRVGPSRRRHSSSRRRRVGPSRSGVTYNSTNNNNSNSNTNSDSVIYNTNECESLRSSHEAAGEELSVLENALERLLSAGNKGNVTNNNISNLKQRIASKKNRYSIVETILHDNC